MKAVKKTRRMGKVEQTAYNIRIIDNGDGTYGLGFVSRFKTCGMPKDTLGEWVEGSRNKMVRLLTKGNFAKKKIPDA